MHHPEIREPDCSKVQASFSADVLPLMMNSCAIIECHDMAGHADGIILVNYERIVQAASQVRFLPSMQHVAGFDAMPQFADKLPQHEIDKVQCWIESGMPEN